MSLESQTVDSGVPAPVEPIQLGSDDKNTNQDPNDSLSAPNEPKFDAADSEAETERLHDSPTKKRLADEIEYQKSESELFRPKPRKITKTSDEEPSESKPDGTPSSPIEEGTNEHKQEAPDNSIIPEPVSNKADGDESTKQSAESSPDEAEAEAEDEPEDEDEQEDEQEDDEDDEDERESDEHRLKAIDSLTEIEIEFANIRNRLHEQQIKKFDLEIVMCEQGLHPELEQYNQQLEENRDAQLQRTRNLLTFEMNSIYTQSRATRYHAHSTFTKNKLELRENLINSVTEKWRKLNNDRSRIDSLGSEFGYYASSQPYKSKRPTDQSLGIVKNERLLGLPLAPNIAQATESECIEDFKGLGLL